MCRVLYKTATETLKSAALVLLLTKEKHHLFWKGQWLLPGNWSVCCQVCSILTSKIAGDTHRMHTKCICRDIRINSAEHTRAVQCLHPRLPQRVLCVSSCTFIRVGMLRHRLWRGELRLQSIPHTTPEPTGHVLRGQDWEEQSWTQFAWKLLSVAISCATQRGLMMEHSGKSELSKGWARLTRTTSHPRMWSLPKHKNFTWPLSLPIKATSQFKKQDLCFYSSRFQKQKYRSEQLSLEKKHKQNWNALAINEAIKSNLC